MARLDKLGGPESYNHYAVGWAHAMNTPYQWTKQVASHWGGTRNGTIVHWPKGIKGKGELRTQFHHVIDVAPTILEAAGLPAAARGRRRPAEADRRRQHAVLLQRRQGGRAARDAVLRDVRQPRHLSQGLDRGDAAQDAVAARRRDGAAVRRRRLGALRHQQGLEPGEQPGEADAGQAARAAAAVADRGDALQRAAARRPRRRTDEPGPRRPARPDQGQDADSLRRHGPPVGELSRERQEQVALGDRRRSRCPRRAPKA